MKMKAPLVLGAFFIVARDRIELPTHGFSVHVPPVVKYKKRQENGARICPMVTYPDQFP